MITEPFKVACCHFLFNRVPVVALVDGDAHGLDIVSVYKFGSMALRHEANKLAAPRVGLSRHLGQRTGIVSSSPLRIFRHALTRTRFGIDKRQLNTDLTRRREEGLFQLGIITS
jgi:hypothetical protein